MIRALTMAMLATALLIAAPAADAASKPQTTWDGLVQVKSKRLAAAFLLPGADFRPYNKIMLDQTRGEGAISPARRTGRGCQSD